MADVTKIICPNCGSIEDATVKYFHICTKCDYIITDSDWEEIYTPTEEDYEETLNQTF